jgi:hypothetical protein
MHRPFIRLWRVSIRSLIVSESDGLLAERVQSVFGDYAFFDIQMILS